MSDTRRAIIAGESLAADGESASIQTRRSLASFLPNVVLSELSLRLRNSASSENNVMCPYSYTFRGACLMADISGFTRLSGAYCAKGKDGLDGLQNATSGYMGRLVQVVYLCGGDVIKFAGDALLCVFRPKPSPSTTVPCDNTHQQQAAESVIYDDDEAYQVACASAVRCAWELKDISTEALSLHVAVSCGTLCLGSLGGFENRWEFLVSGECIMSLSQCLEDAPRKTVVLTKDCYDSVQSLLKVKVKRVNNGKNGKNPLKTSSSDDDSSNNDADANHHPNTKTMPQSSYLEEGAEREQVVTHLEAQVMPSGNMRVTICDYYHAAEGATTNKTTTISAPQLPGQMSRFNTMTSTVAGADRRNSRNYQVAVGSPLLAASASLSYSPYEEKNGYYNDDDNEAEREEKEEIVMTAMTMRDVEDRMRHMYTQRFLRDTSPMKILMALAVAPIMSYNLPNPTPNPYPANFDRAAMNLAIGRGERSYWHSGGGGGITSTIAGTGGGEADDSRKSGTMTKTSSASAVVETNKFVLHLSNDVVTQASCYIPLPVTQAFLSGSFSFLSELREVTTMFVKWDNYDYRKHRDLISLQEYLYASQEILSESGGFLRQFLVDDKGCVFIGLWGVPTATYSDNARRALWAAARIAAKLKDMGMGTSIGITTGVVYCGTVGSSLRQEYAAVGDVVNLSARLMCKAKGGIITDEPTFSRLPKNLKLKLKKLPNVMVKGKDTPITPYQYVTLKLGSAVNGNGSAEGLTLTKQKDNFDDDDDVEVRQVCKDAMTASLKKLLEGNDDVNKGSGKGGEEGEEEGDRQRYDRSVDILIVEDKDGAGNEAAAEWLKRQCFAKDLRMITVHLSNVDATVEYQAVAKLFRGLLKEENFDNIRRQTRAVSHLLHDLYQDDWETINRVAFPTLKHALGVKCPLTECSKRSGGLLIDRSSLGASIGGGREREDNCRSESGAGEPSTNVGRVEEEEEGDEDGVSSNISTPAPRMVANNSNSSGIGVGNISRGNSSHFEVPPIFPAAFLAATAKSVSRRGFGSISGGSGGGGGGGAAAGGVGVLTVMRSVRNFLDVAETPRLSQANEKFRVPPPRLMEHCIQHIFAHLLAEQPLVIVIDEAHNMDESSWNILLALANLHVQSFFVLLQKPMSQLEASRHTSPRGTNAPGGGGGVKAATNNHGRGGGERGVLGAIREEKVAADDAGVSYSWIESYVQRLLRTGHALRIELPDYTFAEARRYLLGKLKISEWNLPPDFDFFFYNMTGNGSLFWVREITAFIVTYGIDEFMRGVKKDTGSGFGSPRTARQIQSPGGRSPRTLGNNNRTFSGLIGFAPIRRDFSADFLQRSLRRVAISAAHLASLATGESNKTPPLVKPEAGGGDAENAPSSPLGLSSRLSMTRLNGGGARGVLQSVHVAPAEMKLEFIVVCRLSKLSPEEQSIIRTASIAGVAFTLDMLSGVVPERIRPYLPAILGSLVKQHWLTVKSGGARPATDIHPSSESTSVRLPLAKYTFAHPLLQRTLYDLTPASVRMTIHLSIAQNIEASHGTDPQYFPALAYHYCNAGELSHDKAFDFSVKAAREMLSASYRCSVDEIIRLLYTATDLVTTDVNVLELLQLVGLCRSKAYEVHLRKHKRSVSFDTISVGASRVYSHIQSGLQSITEMLSPISNNASLSQSPFVTPRFNDRSAIKLSSTFKPAPPGTPTELPVESPAGGAALAAAIAAAAAKAHHSQPLYLRLLSCSACVSRASPAAPPRPTSSNNNKLVVASIRGTSSSTSRNSVREEAKRRRGSSGGSTSVTPARRRLFSISMSRKKAAAPEPSPESLEPANQVARLNRLEKKLQRLREALFLSTAADADSDADADAGGRENSPAGSPRSKYRVRDREAGRGREAVGHDVLVVGSDNDDEGLFSIRRKPGEAPPTSPEHSPLRSKPAPHTKKEGVSPLLFHSHHDAVHQQ